MSPQEFAMWLHGFFELTDAKKLTSGQVKMIREHLDLVFEKITPELLEIDPPATDDKIVIAPFVNPAIQEIDFSKWVYEPSTTIPDYRKTQIIC